MTSTMTLVSLASAAACCSESLTSRLAGTSGWTARTSSSDDVPSLAAIEMPSKRPCLCSSAWAVGRSQIAIVASPSESTVAEGGDAGHLVAALGSERGHGDGVADLEVLAGRRAGVERDLPAALAGHSPVLSFSGLNCGSDASVPSANCGRAAGADGLAVAAEDLGLVGRDRRDRAAGRRDLGQRPDLREQRRGNRRGPALGALDDLLAGDHRVGLLVRRREDAVEAPSGSCRSGRTCR